MGFATFTGVNDTALHVGVSNYIIEELVQNSLYLDGIGITQITTGDMGAGAVRVPKVVVAGGDFRKLGATTNGGWFDTTSIVAKGLDEKIVELLYVYDTVEDVPISQQALSLGGASNVLMRARAIGRKIARGMNGGTLAHQLKANINAVIAASGTETGYIFTYTAGTSGSAFAKFVEACASLDDGDDYNDYFPIEGRLALIRTSLETEMKTVTNNVFIGGSNFAQEMRARGVVSPEAPLPENVNGYRGLINSVPTFVATKAVWDEAEDWLCLSSTHAAVSSGYLDNIVGVVCSHIATLRGHAIPESTKVIDSPTGQGVRIQPLSNFGVEVVFPKGIKLIAKAAFTEGSTALEINAPGSQA